MQRAVKKFAVLSLGWAFIALGVLGLFLPVLQGVLFLLIGLLILSTEYVWAHRLLQKLRERFPRIASTADEARTRAEHYMNRVFSRKKNATSN